MLTSNDHKRLLRHILNLDDDLVQHFDAGGTALSGPASAGSSIPGQTGGIGGLGTSMGLNPLGVPLPQQITSQLPSGVQTALNDINAFNPLNMLQSATQDNFVAQAPTLQQGTNAAQLNQAYDTAQNAIGNQGALLSTLQNQNGIGNQSQVFNQEQATANQLNDIAQGRGPNIAQAMLNNETGKNVANQAALQAGQRGANANVGLMARQIAQQGANTQQQAVGQGAALRANQQLGALGAEQQQQNNMANLATNQVNQLGQATTGYNQSAQNEQNILQSANNAYNNANVSAQSNLNNVNAQISQGNQNASNDLLGGIMNGMGGMLSSLFAEGGEVKNDSARILLAARKKKKLPEHLRAMAKIHHPKVLKHFDDGGDVEANMGDANYTSPAAYGTASIGSMAPDNAGNPFASSKGGGGGGGGGGLGSLMGMAAMFANQGAVVPGKPKVNKNSLKNDVVPALLTPQEIVLPLSVTQAKNPGEAAKKFVEHIKGKGQQGGDFKQALRAHIQNRKAKRK